MLSAIDEYNQHYYQVMDDSRIPSPVMMLGKSLHDEVVSDNADSNSTIAARYAAEEARQQRRHESEQMLGLVPPGRGMTNPTR